MPVIVEIANRSGTEVDEEAAADLARLVLAAEGIEDGDLGLAFVAPDEMRGLKRDHLGQDEATGAEAAVIRVAGKNGMLDARSVVSLSEVLAAELAGSSSRSLS